jgi:hypothetical protein
MYFDGWQRAIQTRRSAKNPQQYQTVQMVFDSLGNQAFTSYPTYQSQLEYMLL